MRQTIIFDEVKRSQKVSGICKKCDKRRSRTISEAQTINPFNKTKEGRVKTYAEVYDSVHAVVNVKVAQLKENFYCATCAGGY